MSHIVDLRKRGFPQTLLSVLGKDRRLSRDINDFMWENVLKELNDELYSKTSLKGKLFLIREDNRQWLLYVSEKNEDEFCEFIGKVVTKEEEICSYKGIVRKLSDRWRTHFKDPSQSIRTPWIEIIANKCFAKRGPLTLMVVQYFTSRGVSATWGRCQDCYDYLELEQ